MPLSRIVVALIVAAQAAAPPLPKGVQLEQLTWPGAEAVLRGDTVVVIPLGAAAKEHGPHLKLRNDLTLAEYLTKRVVAASSVVVAPAIPYHYYPAFAEYPGSTSLSLNAARDLTTDIVRSLARYGPRRFYVLNTGISTTFALKPAATTLASEGILLHYTDLGTHLATASRNVRQQEAGSHADEVETSMMLYIDEASVDMKQAARDISAESRPFRLTRSRQAAGTYSPTGIWGDATLATKAKGQIIVESLVESILADIEALRGATPPAPAPATPPVTRPAPLSTQPPPAPPRTTCTPGDERTIRGIGEAFTAHWSNLDALKLGGLWAGDGDIVHPDGWVERGMDVITVNRRELFTRREYRGSKHPLTLGIIRCLSADIAVADGKWELRGLVDNNGKPVPVMEGLATLVVKRGQGGWNIEAYRYSMKPPVASTPPMFLKRPGYPSGG